jgi:type 1 glutamine amidotransferase
MASDRKKALIVWGGWAGHEPDKGAEIVARMLREEGCEVFVENTTDALADPGIHDLSLIVPIYTISTIEKEKLDKLGRAVASGVGLGGYRGGMGDAFRQAPAYQFMCGGRWVAHPGNISDYRVDIIRRDDPIREGVSDVDYRSEQYYLHVDPAVQVLTTTIFSGEYASWAPTLWAIHTAYDPSSEPIGSRNTRYRWLPTNARVA